MEVGPEAQAGSQGRVGGHASEWGPEELAAEALVAPCARPPVWAGSTPSASQPRYGLWRSPLRPGCRHGARPPEVPVHEPRSGAEARGRCGRPRGSSAGLAGGAWCVSGRSGSLEPGKGQWAERRAEMGRGDVGSFVRRRHLHYVLSGSAGTCRLLCSGLGRGILWRARAGHAANEERKSDVEPQLPRLRAGTAAAGRGHTGQAFRPLLTPTEPLQASDRVSPGRGAVTVQEPTLGSTLGGLLVSSPHLQSRRRRGRGLSPGTWPK